MDSNLIIQQLNKIDDWLVQTQGLFSSPKYCTKKCEIKRKDDFNRKADVVGRSKYMINPTDVQMKQAISEWKDEKIPVAYGYIEGNNRWTFYFGDNHLPRENFDELFNTVKSEIERINNLINWQLESRSDDIRVKEGKQEQYR